MSKTTIREAIEKIVSLAERDKRRPVIGELLAGGELWSDLDFDATDRETLAIFGLVELVENALEKRSSSPEERARRAGGFREGGPRGEAPLEQGRDVLAGEEAREAPSEALEAVDLTPARDARHRLAACGAVRLTMDRSFECPK